LHEKLAAYVYARNATRSAQKAAEGFVSGKRVYALWEAGKAEDKALEALADWVEHKARETLNMPPVPGYLGKKE